jgi:hypothetical protein
MMGRPKNIESPERMWELFEAYKQHVANKPILVQDFVGKDGEEVRREKQRPLTMEGFECFVMDNTNVTYPDLSDYFECKKEGYKNFLHICTRIKREIRADQIAGGMAGIYNPSITQRLNGLVEKSAAEDRSEVTIKVKYEEPRTDGNPE